MKEQFDAGKHYAEVLIDGKIYTLGGAEEEHYLQRVASYISEKISQMKRQEGFSRQSQEYQAVMVELMDQELVVVVLVVLHYMEDMVVLINQ